MLKVTFHSNTEITDEHLKFAVIAARYNGEWIFCRHKKRTTWEIPGGHREADETILETAMRELQEETGATEFEVKPVCIYGVEREGAVSYGMLFWAEIKMLGVLPPEMEIGEIKLCSMLPKELTYPEIQPHLFEYIQGWLNLQSSPDELWDVYDKNRKLTGRTHRRGIPLPEGDYHLVVHVWMRNRNGEYLVTKRAPNKGFPGMWECTGGSALAGDDSLMAAIREVKEETGLTLLPETGRRIEKYVRKDCFVDIWLFEQNFALEDVVLLPGETCDVMYVTKDELLQLQRDGRFVPSAHLDILP